MKDRYLFRGFHKDKSGTETVYLNGEEIKGEWVYGNYVYAEYENRHYITKQLINSHQLIEVIPETIGQYTGLNDKTGKRIFENDVVQYDSGLGGYEESKVYYDEQLLSLNIRNHYIYDGLYNLRNKKNIEVIGTIFDKKEVG